MSDLAELETRETNICITETRDGHIPAVCDTFEYFAGHAHTALTGTSLPLPHANPANAHSFGMTVCEPLGVVGAITAWNYPMMLAAWKAAPALCCGNTIVVKPSELTPATTLRLRDIVNEAAGDTIMQVVEGDGAVGRELCQHSDIAKVSFTGSEATGRIVGSTCGAELKPVTLELGGKSPIIIFSDAHIPTAIEAIIAANFSNAGQACSNGTRVFIQRDSDLLATLLPELEKAIAKIRLGSPHAVDTEMGPLINSAHFNKVMALLDTARGDEDCTFLTDAVACVDSLTVPPTLILCESDDSLVVKKEIFGPVACILPFDTEEEVIVRANSTQYGLAAGVCTKDLARAHRVVQKLNAGTTFINSYNVCPVEMPFGGFNASGHGKELGQAALNHYTKVKSVFVDVSSA